MCIKKIAEIANDQLKKGDVAFVDNILTTRKFTDGKGQERQVFEIVANEVWLAGIKLQKQESPHGELSSEAPPIPDEPPPHDASEFSTLDD